MIVEHHSVLSMLLIIVFGGLVCCKHNEVCDAFGESMVTWVPWSGPWLQRSLLCVIVLLMSLFDIQIVDNDAQS